MQIIIIPINHDEPLDEPLVNWWKIVSVCVRVRVKAVNSVKSIHDDMNIYLFMTIIKVRNKRHLTINKTAKRYFIDDLDRVCNGINDTHHVVVTLSVLSCIRVGMSKVWPDFASLLTKFQGLPEMGEITKVLKLLFLVVKICVRQCVRSNSDRKWRHSRNYLWKISFVYEFALFIWICSFLYMK